MIASVNSIYIDYFSKETKHDFHLPLSVFKKPNNQKEYAYLESILDQIIDEIRDDETHPLAIAAQIIGDNLEDFDDKNQPSIGENVADKELLHYLMEKNNLRQEDLLDIFGNQGNVSKFLNGQRKLSKSQISKLVNRFKISAYFFF